MRGESKLITIDRSRIVSDAYLCRTPQQTAARLDRLIDEIRRIQKPGMNGEKPSDVVLVAHGHILRAFVKRWLGQPMEFPLTMLLEPGGVGAVRYDLTIYKII